LEVEVGEVVELLGEVEVVEAKLSELKICLLQLETLITLLLVQED
jgi:hypothetical protein